MILDTHKDCIWYVRTVLLPRLRTEFPNFTIDHQPGVNGGEIRFPTIKAREMTYNGIYVMVNTFSREGADFITGLFTLNRGLLDDSVLNRRDICSSSLEDFVSQLRWCSHVQESVFEENNKGKDGSKNKETTEIVPESMNKSIIGPIDTVLESVDSSFKNKNETYEIPKIHPEVWKKIGEKVLEDYSVKTKRSKISTDEIQTVDPLILPEGWKQVYSKRKEKSFYFNRITKTRQWELPTEPASHSCVRPVIEKCHVLHILLKDFRSEDPFFKGKPVKRKKLRKMVLDGTWIGELAREKSECHSGKIGGELGPFKKGTMSKEFEEACFALKANELSQVVETKQGHHIILRIS